MRCLRGLKAKKSALAPSFSWFLWYGVTRKCYFSPWMGFYSITSYPQRSVSFLKQYPFVLLAMERCTGKVLSCPTMTMWSVLKSGPLNSESNVLTFSPLLSRRYEMRISKIPRRQTDSPGWYCLISLNVKKKLIFTQPPCTNIDRFDQKPKKRKQE